LSDKGNGGDGESCAEGLPRLVTDVHTTGATDPDVTATTCDPGTAHRACSPLHGSAPVEGLEGTIEYGEHHATAAQGV
jgi:hypothetical protein